MENMRAARLVETGRMVCEQAPVREPAEGEVVVRTQMASICGSDLHSVYMDAKPPQDSYPHGYPGHEGIGEVVESRHPGFRKGERVLTVPNLPDFRCFADYQTLTGNSCIRVPENLPLDQLLMAQQLGTVIFALKNTPAELAGATVMVMGQGSAGMFFSYLLKRAGVAKVIATDLSEPRLDMGKRMGGTDVAVQAGRDDVMEAVMEHTGGRGVDFLVEAVGRRETQLDAVEYVAMDGRILFFGLPDSTNPIPFHFDQFFRKRLRIGTHWGAQVEPELASFNKALELIVKGEIDVSELVSHSYSIEQIDEAMQMANARPASSLKVGIDF